MKGYPSITPLIWYQDPVAALAWLERAFGFETRMVVDDGQGGVIHSEAVFGDSLVMVVGPPHGAAASPAGLTGRHTASVHLQLSDGLDAHCERARAAGAVIQREPATQPYGDRVYTCLDLEGHPWSIGQTIEELTAQQMAAATGRDIREKL
ncbi:MAG TPA: VOC family protein [Caulobacteraceae bacterium]